MKRPEMQALRLYNRIGPVLCIVPINCIRLTWQGTNSTKKTGAVRGKSRICLDIPVWLCYNTLYLKEFGGVESRNRSERRPAHVIYITFCRAPFGGGCRDCSGGQAGDAPWTDPYGAVAVRAGGLGSGGRSLGRLAVGLSCPGTDRSGLRRSCARGRVSARPIPLCRTASAGRGGCPDLPCPVRPVVPAFAGCDGADHGLGHPHQIRTSPS